MLYFKHRPSLGDIVYSLPVIRELGGGTLYLDCRIHGGSQEPYWLLPSPNDSPYENVRIWHKKFSLLIPVLEQQDYITQVKIYEGEDFHCDLDYYMIYHMGGSRDVTITDAHYVGLSHAGPGWPGRTIASPKPTTPWLSLKRNSIKEKGEGKPIVFADTGSWGPGVGKIADMNFLYVLNQTPGVKDLIYNCTPTRYPGIGVERVPTDLLEWAEIIDACELFIGNQSYPLSLAVGFGKNRMLVECGPFPNCTFGHANEFVVASSHEANMQALSRLTRYSPFFVVS